MTTKLGAFFQKEKVSKFQKQSMLSPVRGLGWKWCLWLLVMAFALAGLFRLNFETDILAVLPKEVPAVKAFAEMRDHFQEDERIIALVEHPEGVFEEDVEDLVQHLKTELPELEIEWRSSFEDHPKELAQLLAALWANARPDDLAWLSERLSEENLSQHLQKVREEIRLTINAENATLRSYDPLGFSEIPAIQEVWKSDFSYESEDGTCWLMFIQIAEGSGDYREQEKWVTQVRAATDAWEKDGLQVRLTGGPVYGAEIGGGMERDISGSIAITALLVGVLFFIFQRDLRQLIILGSLIIVVFAITLGFGGWLFGTLNMVSVGFAAILLGLVIDYAVVMARESQSNWTANKLRKVIGPGILWAALTTSAVFGILALSSFPAVRQLGILVVIGLITGAAITLAFLPGIFSWLKIDCNQEGIVLPPLKQKIGTIVLFSLALLSGLVLTWKGNPKLNFESQSLNPENSEAAVAYQNIQKKFPAWSEKNIELLVRGENFADLREKAIQGKSDLKTLEENGLLESLIWPVGLIPHSEFRQKNEPSLKRLFADRLRISQALTAAGFSKKGREFSEQILEGMQDPLPLKNLALPKSFIGETGDGKLFVGRARIAKNESFEYLESIKTIVATGWVALNAQIFPIVARDFRFLFLPTTMVMLIALFLIFRSWKEALLPAAVMLVVLGLVNAFLVLTGQEWNYLNAMALPLIVGTGIDYGIHLIFALRRLESAQKVWHGVGKAIVLCGLSSAIGFGSLIFSSNQTLAGMGLLCSLGVLLTMSLSVLLIPGLWLGLNDKKRRDEENTEIHSLNK